MTRIRVLAIAPYEGLAELMHGISLDYQATIDTKVIVGDLHEGLSEALLAEKQGYDVIVSRGGTSTLIMNHVMLPVVNIGVSGYDYMRAIKTAENFKGRRAIVGFSYITNNAKSVNELLQTDIKIFTIQEQHEIEPLLTQLSNEGYTMVIGDVATVRAAKQTHLIGMLLNSGEESVRQAFEDVLQMNRNINNYKNQIQLYTTILEEIKSEVFVYNDAAYLLYPSATSDVGLSNLDLRQYVLSVFTKGESEFNVISEGALYHIKAKQFLNVNMERRVMFFVNKSKSLSHFLDKGVGIQLYIEDHWDDKTFAREIQRYGTVINQSLYQYVRSTDNMMLFGEPGVGKRRLADIIHRYSQSKTGALLEFDCSVMKKGYLTSLLNKEELLVESLQIQTIYFHEIQKLGIDEQQELYRCLTSDRCYDNIRIIASCVGDADFLLENGRMNKNLFYHIATLVLRIPGLNEMKEKIESLANLYLIDANTKYGKQVVGFAGEAIESLKNYTWRYNYRELRNVINQAVLSSTSSYVQAYQIKAIFETLSQNLNHKEGIEFQGTLVDIEKQAIQRAIDVEKGNLTKAAKRLGIGRSTLWRKIKEIG